MDSPFEIVAVVAVVAVTIGAVAWWLLREVELEAGPVFNEVADLLGAELEHTGVGYPRIEAARHGVRVTMTYVPDGRDFSADIRLSSKRRTVYRLLLSHEHETVRSAPRGLRKIEVDGDVRFAVRTDDERRCRAFLSRPAAAELVERLAERSASLVVTGEEVLVVKTVRAAFDLRDPGRIFPHNAVNPAEIVALTEDAALLARTV